jgi:hypothetical protein
MMGDCVLRWSTRLSKKVSQARICSSSTNLLAVCACWMSPGPHTMGFDPERLEQPGLGAVGDLAGRGKAPQGCFELYGGACLARFEAGNHGERPEVDAGLRALVAHGRLELVAVGLDASAHLVGVDRSDAAELELGRAPICHDVARRAAVDQVPAGRRVRDVVASVVGS